MGRNSQCFDHHLISKWRSFSSFLGPFIHTTKRGVWTQLAGEQSLQARLLDHILRSFVIETVNLSRILGIAQRAINHGY